MAEVKLQLWVQRLHTIDKSVELLSRASALIVTNHDLFEIRIQHKGNSLCKLGMTFHQLDGCFDGPNVWRYQYLFESELINQ